MLKIQFAANELNKIGFVAQQYMRCLHVQLVH